MADPKAQERYQKLFSAELGTLLAQGHALLDQVVEWLTENKIDPEQVSYPLFKMETDKTGQRYITFTCMINEIPVEGPRTPSEPVVIPSGTAGPRTPRHERGRMPDTEERVQRNPVQESLDRRN